MYCFRLCLFFCSAFFLCNSLQAQPMNTLTASEQAAGWRLLFNGKNLMAGIVICKKSRARPGRWKRVVLYSTKTPTAAMQMMQI